MRKLLILSVFLFLGLLGREAKADCAVFPSGQELIDQSDLIFLGKPIKTSKPWLGLPYTLGLSHYNYFTKFKVTQNIKGGDQNYYTVYYNHSQNSSPTVYPIKINEGLFIFFSDLSPSKNQYIFSTCNRLSIQVDRTLDIWEEYKSVQALVEYSPDLKHHINSDVFSYYNNIPQ